MNEIWRTVVYSQNVCQISSFGNFRRNPEKPRKATYSIYMNRLGYPYVSITLNGKKTNKTLHQLVAAAFIPSFKYGMHVNHIDGDKTNNTLTNLEISSPTHNNTHAHTLSTTRKPGKSKYRNVSIRLDKRDKCPKVRYLASVKINSKRHYIGIFDVEEEAAKAVDTYLDFIGDTARIRNFP